MHLLSRDAVNEDMVREKVGLEIKNIDADGVTPESAKIILKDFCRGGES